MSDELFEKKAEFLSWCIEEYASAKSLNASDVANMFAREKVLDFLDNHYEVLHTQGKAYILSAIADVMTKKDRA